LTRLRYSNTLIPHDRLTQQVDPELSRLMHKLIVNPLLAMIIVLPCERIVPRQEARPHRPGHHMHNRNLIRRKHLHPCQPSHISNSFNAPSRQSAFGTCRRIKSEFHAMSDTCCDPVVPVPHSERPIKTTFRRASGQLQCLSLFSSYLVETHA